MSARRTNKTAQTDGQQSMPDEGDSSGYRLSADEAVKEAIEQRPVAVCIGAISPTRGAEVRAFCRRLRNAAPDTKVIVLRPRVVEVDIERSATRMQEAGADIVVVNAKDAVEAIERLLTEAPATRASSALAAVNS